MIRSVHLYMVACLACACTSAGGDEPAIDQGDKAAGTTRPARVATCGVVDTTHLSSSGIGELRIGASASTVREKCGIVSDTVEADAEAMPQRVLVVDLGRGHARALVADDRVWRIEISGRSFRSADSLGVGMTLSELLSSREEVSAIEGDGLLYAIVRDHCGLSFRLTHAPEADEHRSTWSEEDLEKLPAETAIDLVLITGCDTAQDP